MVVYINDGAGGSTGGTGIDLGCDDGGGTVGQGEGLKGGRGEEGRVEVKCEIVVVFGTGFLGNRGGANVSTCSDRFLDVRGLFA